MSFLMRGRSSRWLRDQTHPHGAERAPETVTAATGLPVAAPAPQGGTEALRPDMTLAELRAIAFAQAERLRVAPPGCGEDVLGQARHDGTAADRQWVIAELGRLQQLATLTEEHGPWAAAQHMYGGTR